MRFNPSCRKSLSLICIFFICLILSRGLIATFSWQPYSLLEGGVLNWFDIFHVVSIFLTGKQAEVGNFHTSWGALMFFSEEKIYVGYGPVISQMTSTFTEIILLHWLGTCLKARLVCPGSTEMHMSLSLQYGVAPVCWSFSVFFLDFGAQIWVLVVAIRIYWHKQCFSSSYLIF